jgi:hypothetical protein
MFSRRIQINIEFICTSVITRPLYFNPGTTIALTISEDKL